MVSTIASDIKRFYAHVLAPHFTAPDHKDRLSYEYNRDLPDDLMGEMLDPFIEQLDGWFKQMEETAVRDENELPVILHLIVDFIRAHSVHFVINNEVIIDRLLAKCNEYVEKRWYRLSLIVCRALLLILQQLNANILEQYDLEHYATPKRRVQKGSTGSTATNTLLQKLLNHVLQTVITLTYANMSAGTDYFLLKLMSVAVAICYLTRIPMNPSIFIKGVALLRNLRKTIYVKQSSKSAKILLFKEHNFSTIIQTMAVINHAVANAQDRLLMEKIITKDIMLEYSYLATQNCKEKEELKRIAAFSNKEHLKLSIEVEQEALILRACLHYLNSKDVAVLTKQIVHSRYLLDVLVRLNSVELLEAVLNVIIEIAIDGGPFNFVTQLFFISCSVLKRRAYQLLHEKASKHLHCLTEGEPYSHKVDNMVLLQRSIFGVPLSAAHLRAIVYLAGGEPGDAITEICKDFLLMIVNSRLTLTTQIQYSTVLNILGPVLPYLVALISNSDTKIANLSQALMGLLHPDVQHFSTINIIRGNLAAMFHKDPLIRHEATQRCSYLLLKETPKANCGSDLFIVDRPLTHDKLLSVITEVVDGAIKPPSLNILIKSLDDTTTEVAYKFRCLWCQLVSGKRTEILKILEDETDIKRTFNALYNQRSDDNVRENAAILLAILLFENLIQIKADTLLICQLLKNLRLPITGTYVNTIGKFNSESKSPEYFNDPAAEMTYWHLEIQYNCTASMKSIETIPTLPEIRSMLTNLKCERNQLQLVQLEPVIYILLMLKAAMYPELGGTLIQLVRKIVTALRTLRRPMSETDLLIFNALLDIITISIDNSCAELIEGLIADILCVEEAHFLITELQNEKLNVYIHQRVCYCLGHLLTFKGIAKHWLAKPGQLGKIFKQTLGVARKLQNLNFTFEIFNVLSKMAIHQLQLDDELISKCCMYFDQFCLYQCKDPFKKANYIRAKCMEIQCRLHKQLSDPVRHLVYSNKSTAMYASSCLDSNKEQRLLGWTMMLSIGTYTRTMLIDTPDLLGVLYTRALSSLLDEHEAMCIRDLAGRYFILMSAQRSARDVLTVLQQHDFMNISCREIDRYYDGEFLTTELYGIGYASCILISCYIQIYIMLLHNTPDLHGTLQKQPFLLNVYRLISQHHSITVPSLGSTVQYLRMCGDICYLYTRCFRNNRYFVYRTLCCDQYYLSSFCESLYNMLSCARVTKHLRILEHGIEMLLMLCNDNIAYNIIVGRLTSKIHEFYDLVEFVLSRSHDAKSIRISVMYALSLLLIKSQKLKVDFSGERMSFTEVLNLEVEENGVFKLSFAKRMFNLVLKQFNCAYSDHERIFERTPTRLQRQVCATMGAFLKLSSEANDLACELQLLNLLLDLINNFFDELAMPASTYIKTKGEPKATAIIGHLTLIFTVIFQWHSAHHANLSIDQQQAVVITGTLLRIWPWCNHGGQLKVAVYTACAFMAYNCAEMCAALRTSQSADSDGKTVLQLVIKEVLAETTAVHAEGTDDFPIILRGLGIMTSSTMHAEGWYILYRANVLHVFDQILPANKSKSIKKCKPAVLEAWLHFGYHFLCVHNIPDVHMGPQSLHGLISTIANMKRHSNIRIICLKILARICSDNRKCVQFVEDNRLHETLYEILKQPLPLALEDVIISDCRSISGGDCNTCNEDRNSNNSDAVTYQELCIVVEILQRIFCHSVKYKAIMRNTRFAKQLRKLYEQLDDLDARQPRALGRVPFGRMLLKRLERIVEDSL